VAVSARNWVWAIEAGAWWFRRRAEEREFAFIHDKLTAIDSRIGELSVSVGR